MQKWIKYITENKNTVKYNTCAANKIILGWITITKM